MAADLAFINGTVVTIDEARPEAEAVAVAVATVGNRIARVGSNAARAAIHHMDTARAPVVWAIPGRWPDRRTGASPPDDGFPAQRSDARCSGLLLAVIGYDKP